MDEQIQKLLDKHNYRFILEKQGDLIILHVPANKFIGQETPYSIIYQIVDGGVIIRTNDCDDDEAVKLECPDYAYRMLILADVRIICEKWGFDSRLVELVSENDIINESEFFAGMLPDSITLDDETKAKEYALRQVVQNAMNSLIPFDMEYLVHAQQSDVELGYQIVRNLFFTVGDSE